ncbi:phospholipase D family protein [Paraburkholderia sp. RL18-103-BIB-C]|uniref:phospholipase D family protein n=1 Tax=Paraburkholderia sp. RL18-103-BIB-C TaxID=3031637 RepID=UPI0038BA9D05
MLPAIRRTIFKEFNNDEPHVKAHSNGTSNVFITSANYEDKILKLIDSGERVSAAVAFLGDGCDELLGRSTATVRLLCNLLSGGTNPKAVDALRAYRSIEIRHLPNLHAKVILGESKAIVGSANLSENGLTEDPDAGSGWHEAGFLVNDRESLQTMDAWYEKLWTIALPVTEDDMKKARIMWAARRTAAFVGKGRAGGSFADVSKAQIEGVSIYVCIYSDDASEQAIKAASAKLSEIEQGGSPVPSVSPYEIFDGWSSLPSDGPLLCFRANPDGSLTSEGAWKYIEGLDTSYRYGRQRNNVFFSSPVRKVLEWKYAASDGKLLANRLEPAYHHILSKQNSARGKGFVTLYDALTLAGVENLRP